MRRCNDEGRRGLHPRFRQSPQTALAELADQGVQQCGVGSEPASRRPHRRGWRTAVSRGGGPLIEAGAELLLAWRG
ncbi:hypothetical protein [Streptomyces azureus]|uniref:hypothetical protein n=1 Tax=Streptomyces azureus TaxID=146537 RepID=UPI0011E02D94|nr:hypothetical protein [Streptomyces azureus]